MKIKIYLVLFAFVLCIMTFTPVFADEHPDRVVDYAGLLTETEAQLLRSDLDELSERQQFDVAVVTVYGLEGKTPAAFADDYYDYNGYGMGVNHDGVLLLINMKERDWYVTTTGYGINAITDAGLDYMSDKFLPELSNGDYYKAFNTFAKLCDEFVTQSKKGEPYDVGNLPKEPLRLIWILVSVIAGLIIAFIGTNIMRAQLKSVRLKATASDYIKSGSFKVTDASELFLYYHIDRIEKPKDSGGSGGSSTHTSSSGTSHGGGGGKF